MPNWEDTVMKPEKIRAVIGRIYNTKPSSQIPIRKQDTPLLEAQAEISFKAGMREVVEWVNKHIAFGNIPASYKEWQDFKKSLNCRA
ncbi:hypothetical protein LCGC14_1766460 [marine sediment metagenome]|uniref:Uncharacterized protein n=1 Tax=marine sediment metagenome TaxID=412755 RepID=A0A0F9GZI3_9ZZZZ